ncbi:MAG: PIG-L family deacetylase [Planctomycetota bacterium]
MLAALLACAQPVLPQIPSVPTWRDLQGRSESGIVALHQAVLDAGSDTLVMVVASHPDDRYVLPAAWLRYRLGARAVLVLATRGGGGQNILGPETGDALERIRTLETEAGCAALGVDAFYLDCPDAGYCRTAEEAFAEWGRQETLLRLVRAIRLLRPDLVLTTHNAEETHGHDLALFQILPEAVAAAADPAFEASGLPSHSVRRLLLGAPSTPPRGFLVLPMDVMDPVRGATLRRLGYSVLEMHRSAGPLSPMDALLQPELVLMPAGPGGGPAGRDLVEGLPSLFDPRIWPGSAEDARRIRTALSDGLRAEIGSPEKMMESARAAIESLRAVHVPEGSDAAARRDRRIEALERVIRHCGGLQVEVEAEPGAVAVPGEDLPLVVRLHNGGTRDVASIRATASEGAEVGFVDSSGANSLRAGTSLRTGLVFRVPLAWRDSRRMKDPFHGDRFEPPIRMRFHFAVDGMEIPVDVTAPIELKPPLELQVVPRALLIPNSRSSVQFTVEVQRNSNFPIEDQLEVRAPAGYSVEGARRTVRLDETRGDSFLFRLQAPERRKSGVDVLRILVGGARIALPVHKVDVDIDPSLRVGIVRGSDDTLLSVIHIGGFGLQWSELSDMDLAVRDLDEFDTIAVDFRALRNRPEARRSYRRLLAFCRADGKRLVVFYHKDSEFHPAGEGFIGAPILPFLIGKNRVSRSDAPVTVLRPDHVLMRSPNAIRSSDWDGWEQERGLYFPCDYAEDYQEILEMHDPGLPAERGALLYARVGGGEFVYCALSLYRQLKKLHPGAVRLLANLLTPGR